MQIASHRNRGWRSSVGRSQSPISRADDREIHGILARAAGWNRKESLAVISDEMLEYWDPGEHRLCLAPRSSTRYSVVVDPTGTLGEAALELRLRLARLGEERYVACEVGLIHERAYVEDLNREVAETRTGYAAAVVLQLASLRAELGGRRWG